LSTARPIDSLTGLRGVAAWWIVMFHFQDDLPAGTPHGALDWARHGYLAVDLFFEMSGFIIALNYSNILTQFSVRKYFEFIGVRLARIYPLHVFMLFLFLINVFAILAFSHQATPGSRYSPDYFLMSLFLVQNWGFTRDLAWNVPAWSISTEFFAYILFPLLLLVSRRIARNAALSLAAALVLILLLGGIFRSAGMSLGDDVARFGLIRCIMEFWCGIVLFRLRGFYPASSEGRANLLLLVSAICLAASVILHLEDYVLVPTIFFFLIYSLSGDFGFLSRLLKSNFLLFVGACSYSTYLVHYFVRDWIKFLFIKADHSPLFALGIYLGATAVLSVVLYRLIEIPGRRAMRSLVLRRTRLVSD
jgi:peptidoglycan/LPS O-acetylase OafA/YrhL